MYESRMLYGKWKILGKLLRTAGILLFFVCVSMFPVSGMGQQSSGGADGASGAADSSEPILQDTGDVHDRMTITDALGRRVTVPLEPEYVICSGSGALRLLTYLNAQDRAAAVDDMELRRSEFDARPYALAHPEFKKLPLFGEFRGFDNPELIVSLDPQPQVIFKTYPVSGYDPEQLQQKTGIPVVTLEYGDLTAGREALYETLLLMGEIIGRQERAEAVIAFFNDAITDLQERTAHVPEQDRTSCYIGGIAYRGPHGITSTEPAYPPFLFVGADNTAFQRDVPLKQQLHADISKEKLIMWDPEVLFIDVSTMQTGGDSSALYQLEHEPIFEHLQAKRSGEIYGVLPYNLYTQNFGSIFVNAYFIGSVLYPEEFSDIDPAEKADEIYHFLVGEPVYSEMQNAFGGYPFSRIEIP